jgi:hypothetical protein
MDKSNKLNLVAALIDMNAKISWTAQRPQENVYQYNERTERNFNVYSRLIQAVLQRLPELRSGSAAREEFAIYCYIKGLSKDVRRYICDARLYTHLYQVQFHARQIETHLNDIKTMRRISLLEETIRNIPN